MKIAYFVYTINSKNQLLVSCYHQQFTARAAYSLLAKDIFPNIREAGMSQVKIAENQEEENIKQAIFEELEKIIGNRTISKLIFSADVNLCTQANGTLAKFLIDDSMLIAFPNIPKIKRILESSTPNVVKEAKDFHQNNWSGSPITIRIKADRIASVNHVDSPAHAQNPVNNHSEQYPRFFEKPQKSLSQSQDIRFDNPTDDSPEDALRESCILC